MHNTETRLRKWEYTFLGDFEIQTNHLISARRRPDLVIVNKKEDLPNILRLCLSGRSSSKTEGKWKERWIPGPYSRTEKAMEYDSDSDTNCN